MIPTQDKEKAQAALSKPSVQLSEEDRAPSIATRQENILPILTWRTFLSQEHRRTAAKNIEELSPSQWDCPDLPVVAMYWNERCTDPAFVEVIVDVES